MYNKSLETVCLFLEIFFVDTKLLYFDIQNFTITHGEIMINEVYVIQDSGIPLYYYNHDQLVSDDDFSDDLHTLQAGFFAAIVQFGAELAKDELRYIVFDNRTYGIKRNNDIYVVFSENVQLTVGQLDDLDKKLITASDYLNMKLEGKPLDITMAVNEAEMDTIVGDFSDFLVKENIIQGDIPIDKGKLKKQVRNFVFRSVGYEPGKCNIGKRERMQRLSVGMISISIGLALFAVIFLTGLYINYSWLVFFLVIPFFLGFNGIYQYFFKFCVTNALKKQYNMS